MAASNKQKHGISFRLASTVFLDPAILTFFDEQHSALEERWCSLARAETGVILAIVYTWTEIADQNTIRIRIISGRKAGAKEMSLYEEQALL